jgi:hypothetical protein
MFVRLKICEEFFEKNLPSDIEVAASIVILVPVSEKTQVNYPIACLILFNVLSQDLSEVNGINRICIFISFHFHVYFENYIINVQYH